MMRCIELAKKGLGNTYPNPLVGSVIMHDGKVLGEGWHHKAGDHHAEVMAVTNVADPKLLKDSTLYVNLEPCSHFGKTPPCASMIIDKGIRNIVVGSLDPNQLVAGKGIEMLEKAGCKVVHGVMLDECDQLNKRFFTYHNKQRPYIILKWAETKNGFIAPLKDDRVGSGPFWISNEHSKQLVHKWRSEEQAILVGTQTVLDDNPRLTTREWDGNSPVRILIDKGLKIPEDASILDKETKTIVITEEAKENEDGIVYERMKFSENNITGICDLLYKNQIQSVIIEGGAKTIQHFIDSNTWDEARVFIGAKEINDGVSSPKIQLNPTSKEKIKSDILMIYHND